MATIYANIDSNIRNTWFIVFAFVGVLAFMGWFIGIVFFEGDGLTFTAFALIIAGITSFISYYNSDKIVLAVSGAILLEKQNNLQVFNIVQNLCIGAGLPMPKIYTINDTAMNAFATGRDPAHAVLCLTSGIIDRLDKLELEGVIAHELSHIGNYDIRLMSIVSVLVGTVTLLADFFTRGMFYGGRRSRDNDSQINGLLMILGLILIILSPIIATLIQLAVSREREFLADASGALLTRYPKGLADALVKISNDREVLEAANGATAHLYICSPLRSEQIGGFFAGLFDTHPPIKDRIKRLHEM